MDPEYFAMGNIAPDSGIPDENWENFDPPPEILHFKAQDDEEWRLADLEFYGQHLHSQKEKHIAPEHFSFLLGYFFHLVTDNLWDEQIGNPTSERFAEEFEADPKFIWQVKRDWYGLDFEHVRSKPGSIYWRVFLDCEYSQDYLDFLPKEAVQQRLEYIKKLYQRTDEKIEEWYVNRPEKYLSKDEMDAFIQSSTGRLYRIYHHLWLDNVEVPHISSSLGLNIE
jgi:hypothetical protein